MSKEFRENLDGVHLMDGEFTDGSGHEGRPAVTRQRTIWEALAEKLGREPTNAEACEEVRRILSEGHQELAEAGKLRHQRGLLP